MMRSAIAVLVCSFALSQRLSVVMMYNTRSPVGSHRRAAMTEAVSCVIYFLECNFRYIGVIGGQSSRIF